MSKLRTAGETAISDSADIPTARQLADKHGLRKIGGRPPLRGYLAETWRRRRFAWQLAKSRHHAESSRTKLGRLWNILNPLMEVALYGVIYYYLMGSGNRPGNYTAFITIGIVVFNFTSRGMTVGARSIEGNSGLIRSIRFPRTLLPVAVILQNLLGLLPTICLMLPVVWLTGEPITTRWLLLIPALALAALFSLALAFFFAWFASFFRDVLQLMPHANRVLLHMSGVFFAIHQIDGAPWLRTIMEANPFGWFMTLARSALMNPQEVGQEAAPSMWFIATGVTLAFLLVSYFLFWSGEKRYGRD